MNKDNITIYGQNEVAEYGHGLQITDRSTFLSMHETILLSFYIHTHTDIYKELKITQLSQSSSL